MDDTDLLAANGLGVLEGISEDTLGGLAGDELDALDDAINDNVLDAGVFTLGVLSDQDGVDTIVGGLEAGDGAAGSQVGEEVEGSSEGEVEGDVALANGGLLQQWMLERCRRGRTTACARGSTYSERTLEGNLVLLDVLNGSVGDGGLAVLEDGSDVDGLPGNGSLSCALVLGGLHGEAVGGAYLGGGEDVLDGLGNLRADTVTLDQADEEVALDMELARRIST